MHNSTSVPVWPTMCVAVVGVFNRKKLHVDYHSRNILSIKRLIFIPTLGLSLCKLRLTQKLKYCIILILGRYWGK